MTLASRIFCILLLSITPFTAMGYDFVDSHPRYDTDESPLLTKEDSSLRMLYKETLYPVFVDLSYQFFRRVPQQSGGTCHIFAATSLIESMCYRATQKHIKISEGYFAYRHFRQRLFSGSSLEISALLSTPYYIYSYDGGQSVDTVDRFLNRSVCSAKEISFYDHFSPVMLDCLHAKRTDTLRINGMFDTVSDPPEVKKRIINTFRALRETHLPKEIARHLDSSFLKLLPNANYSDAYGVTYESAHPDIQACLKNTGNKKNFRRIGIRFALELLSKGVPFVCETNRKYPHDSKGELHAMVFLGYRYNSSVDYQIEFLIRDSNRVKHTWTYLEHTSSVPLVCDSATVLLTNEELEMKFNLQP